MIDELRPYPAYKDSYVRWLASVPSHWSILPGKAVFNEIYRSNKGMVESTVLSLSFGKIVVKPKEKLHGLVPESFETYQVIEPGDIIIRPTDLQNDWNSLRTSISPHRGIITSAYIALHPRGKMDSDFCDRMLRTYDLLKVFYGLGCGLRQNLSWADFKYLPCVLPPPDEQAAIVKFLDYANGKIERAIRAKRKLIGLLNEQKQAIIHRAVTRGLDPNVKLKPSGIPWLGDVPEHWEVRKIKSLVKTMGGMTPSKGNEKFWNGDIPWVSPKDMKSREINDSIDHITEQAICDTNISLINPPAVLIVVRGMILARTFPTSVTKVPVTINQDMKALITRPELNADYLVSVLSGIQGELLALVEIAGHGTCCLRTDSWGNFMLPIPPLKEQNKIRKFLHSELNSVTSAITRTEQEINLLREYRTTLTAEVVTGKLDVREAAKRLPDEAVETLPTDDSIDEMIDDEIPEEDDA